MIMFQRYLHKIHKFKDTDSLYVADLERCQVVEIDSVIWDILDGYSQFGDEEQLMAVLSERHDKGDLESAFETLSRLERMGLIFGSKREGAPHTLNCQRPKIFVYGSYFQNVRGLASGASIAHRSLLQAMVEYADLYFVDNTGQVEFEEGTYGIPFNLSEPSSLLMVDRYAFDGIFVEHPTRMELISVIEQLNAPVVVPIHTIRGHGGNMINRVLIWYAAMREFDAFYGPANAVREFYSRFLLDSECFYTIYNGVDADFFTPMDKGLAKKQVAQIVNDDRFRTQPVVGFLSRFQPEKGAGIYIRLAEMLPDVLFLAVAPQLNVYSIRHLPPNFIYSGRQPREKLPLFFNAFDVFCFPSMVGEETCPLSLLEAMACGLPIVAPDFTGIPEILGDVGILVPATTFPHEIGSFAAFPSLKEMHEQISMLLNNEAQRRKLGHQARERALQFTWKRAAQNLIQLFKRLNEIRVVTIRHRNPGFSVVFSDGYEKNRQHIQGRAILLNHGKYGESPLMFNSYVQRIEEGLALELAQKHRFGELEAIFMEFFRDADRVKNLLMQIKGFITANS